MRTTLPSGRVVATRPLQLPRRPDPQLSKRVMEILSPELKVLRIACERHEQDTIEDLTEQMFRRD